MQLKRHDLMPSLSLFALLSLLVLTFLALAPRSVEVRVYDVHTGDLLSHAVVENLAPARRQYTMAGWLFLSVKRRLLVSVTAAGYLPAEASWYASYPWILRGRLDVPLSPTQLTGIVRHAETGLPLPDAEVEIGTAKLVADASGMFYLSPLAGDMTASVQLDGYEPWQGEVLWESHLLRGELLTVGLWPNLVEGQVCDQETGKPLPGATVTAAGQQWVTDRMGRFRLRRLRLGDTITTEQEGFWPAEVTYTGQPLDVVLRSDLVEGQVRWQETGEPLPGTTVTAVGQQWVTDQRGCFNLRRLRPGDVITVEREGFWAAEVTYVGQLLGIALQDRRAQVVVQSALEAVELSGLEVTRNGQRLEAISSGVFELRASTAGELLEAAARGHWPVQIRLGTSGSRNVGEVEEIEMVLQPRVLTVTVRDDYTGWPLPGALVSSSLARPADIRGQVVLAPAVPGMAISIEYPGYVSRTLQYDGQASELEVRLVPHTIQGVVVDAGTGRPVSGAVLGRGGQTLLRTAPDGSFRLEGLTEQPVFTVRVPGYRPAQVGIGDCASPVVPRPCAEGAASGSPCWEVRLAPFEVRGVYIPFGLLYSRQRTLAVLDMTANTELNAVVVDVKGDRGWLAYASDLPLATELGVPASGVMDLGEFLDICRRRGIYTIARLVVFKDNPLAYGKPELAVKQADGTVWLDREKLGWANPFREEVWDYNIGIAQEVAQLGFDEVQLDYVRFPSDGDLDKIAYEEEDTPETKTTAIRTFMARMRESLAPYDVFLSVDVFGLTLVVDPQTGMGIGQRVIDIAPYVDYLCPMVYPSTFIPGNLGMANPALHPYEVVEESLRRGMALTSTLIRPWLQAYSLHGVKYGLEQQRAQRRAAEIVGASGWTFWNAGGRYDEHLFRRRAVAEAERLDDGGKLVE